MPASDKKDKAFAQKLLEISKEGDRVTQERVDAVLAYLRQKQPRGLRRILKHYMKYVQRSISRSHAVIECAGSITPEQAQQLEQSFSHYYGRSISSEVVQNLDLIAGVRVHVADDVWDETVAAHLETLKNA